MLCPKRRIHNHCIKLFRISFCLQRTHVTLDQVHVRNLKFLSIPSEYFQRVIVDVKANTYAERVDEDRNIMLSWLIILKKKKQKQKQWPEVLTLHRASQPQCSGLHSHIQDQPPLYPQCHQTYSGLYKACMLTGNK